MKLVLLGFPKSGTHTIHYAAQSAGQRSLHCARSHVRLLGERLMRQWAAGRGPLGEYAEKYDVLTECSVTAPHPKRSFWPFLNLQWIESITRLHPEVYLLLNTRNSVDWVDSINRWQNDYAGRLAAARLPGLREGESDFARWQKWHYDRVRVYLTGYERFVEMDIADPRMPDTIGRLLGADVEWWGVANKNEEKL